MTLDPKLIGQILVAAALAFGELHENSSVRSDVGQGMVSFVASQLDPRDKRIDDLQMEIRELKDQVNRGKR